VSRASTSAVVTVRGELDDSGCELLDTTLIDLIECHGNRMVAVDLAQAVAGPAAAAVLMAAASRARRRGVRFIVKGLPQHDIDTSASTQWTAVLGSILGDESVEGTMADPKSRCREVFERSRMVVETSRTIVETTRRLIEEIEAVRDRRSGFTLPGHPRAGNVNI
jgi:anti-anti-sigma regulatory factor